MNSYQIKDIKIGNSTVSKIYIGDILLWPYTDCNPVYVTTPYTTTLTTINECALNCEAVSYVITHKNYEVQEKGFNRKYLFVPDNVKEISGDFGNIITVLDGPICEFRLRDSSLEVLQCYGGYAIPDLRNCESLRTVMLERFSGKGIQYMQYEDDLFNLSPGNNFGGCTNLEYVNIGETQKFTSANSMFFNCNNLKTVNLFDTSSVTDMSYMFYNCYKLEAIPTFNFENVKYTNYMFYSTRQSMKLKSFPSINSTNLIQTIEMFYGCDNLETVGNFVCDNIEGGIRSMFTKCYELKNVGRFENLGKSFQSVTATTAGWGNVSLSFASSKLTRESCLNIFDSVYSMINHPTYTHIASIVINSPTRELLSDDDIGILLSKGWSLSINDNYV